MNGWLHAKIAMTTIPQRSVLFFLTFLLLGSSLCLAKEATVRPNVILIMADDLGYGDLSCYGSKKNRTPELDQLAAAGMRLTSFYSGATVCTPSRMALLTGCYPSRLGWQGGVMGHKMSPQTGLPTAARTMAEIFKAAKYRTALVGKWHLGEAPGFLPNDRGFEEAFYIRSSNNQTTKLWHNEKLIADPFDNHLLTEQFTSAAIRIIRERSDKPFFLYLPFSAPHFPAEAHPDWKGKSANGEYGDVVEELDSRIGQIRATLKETDQEKNTLIVFLSDNGPEGSQRGFSSAEPYRGGKWTALEGGTRVPCLISWPGVIPPSQVNDEIVAAIDLLPTLAHFCGIMIEQKKDVSPLDGMIFWSAFVNRDKSGPPRKSLLFWEGWATPQAIRVDSWKLYFDEVKDIPDSKTGPALFDLTNDPKEQYNLAKKQPERVAAMLAEARAQLKNIHAKSLPLAGVGEKNPPKKAKLPLWLD
jgi:arylsulfatase A-like enzyme